LKLKLTIQVSPRTVGKDLHRDGPVRTPDRKQRWLTFVRNHAKVMVACDFFVVITATFRTLYVFLVVEIGSRRILHFNVTARIVPAVRLGCKWNQEKAPSCGSCSHGITRRLAS
jgi:putative transposase